MIRILFLTGIFLLFTSGAMGEYYQYTDESGNVRFTDDMTQIPDSRRDSVEKFASETSGETETAAAISYVDSQSVSASADERIPEEYTAPSGEGETFEIRAAELNKFQAELNKTRHDLEKERAELQARAPSEDAKNKDRIAYSMEVDALNAKIEKYEKDLKAFEKKVEAFNNRKKMQE